MPLLAPDELSLIEVTGDDRIDYLDSVTTQKLEGVAPGQVRGALVLDAKGSPLASFWVLVHAERLALLAPPAARDHVLEVLATRTFLADVTFEEVPGRIFGLYGHGVDAALAAAGVTGLAAGHWRPAAGSLVARHAFGAQIIGDGLATTLYTVEEVEVGNEAALEHARIAAGEPRLGHEVAAGRLPEEFGLMQTHVHLAKGCYPGQEAVAHMWNLGRPRRRLAQIQVERGGVGPGWVAGAGKQRVEVTGLAGDLGLAMVPADAHVGDSYGDGDASVLVLALVGDGPPAGLDPNRRQRRYD